MDDEYQTLMGFTRGDQQLQTAEHQEMDGTGKGRASKREHGLVKGKYTTILCLGMPLNTSSSNKHIAGGIDRMCASPKRYSKGKEQVTM